MDNITPGHWVFALIFALTFIGYLIWAYRKDIRRHNIYYKRSYIVLLTILIGAAVLYYFKDHLN
ncbi:hypothetical protein HZ996_07240 [Cryomorphaceae bacterium]|nr:hypothetical protein HZ996_07240 [Cryomorphaceae bacterium]